MCTKCDYECRVKKSFRNHLKIHNEEQGLSFVLNSRGVCGAIFCVQSTNNDRVLRSIPQYCSINYQIKHKTCDKMCQNLTECDYVSGQVSELCFRKAQNDRRYWREINERKLIMHQNLIDCEYSDSNIVKHLFTESYVMEIVRFLVKLLKNYPQQWRI